MRDTVSPPQWQWEYRYSAGGERESKRMVVAPLDDHSTLSHQWTYYLLSGSKQQLAVYNGRETSETDGCSNTDHRVHFYPVEYLTYGVGTSALITTRPNQFREYKIVDHLGSTRVVLDTNGSILSTYDYEPFGKPLAKKGLDSRKSYVDKEQDKESDLADHGARKFDYETGRFTSVDMLWEKYRELTPYQYSANNPLVYRDLNGKVIERGCMTDEQWVMLNVILIPYLRSLESPTVNAILDKAESPETKISFNVEAHGGTLKSVGDGERDNILTITWGSELKERSSGMTLTYPSERGKKADVVIEAAAYNSTMYEGNVNKYAPAILGIIDELNHATSKDKTDNKPENDHKNLKEGLLKDSEGNNKLDELKPQINELGKKNK